MINDIIDRYYPVGTKLRDIFLSHSRDVATLALEINARLPEPLNEQEVETAAMLHDIGIFLCNAPSIECRGNAPYIAHGYLGADLLRREGWEEKYARVCERHTGVGLSAEEINARNLPLPHDRTYEPVTTLEKLVCYADKFYSKSGDGKRKTRSEVIDSLARFGSSNVEKFLSMEKSLKGSISY